MAFKVGDVYQDVIVYQIQERFGDEFVYVNQNGNVAINRNVLTEISNAYRG